MAQQLDCLIRRACHAADRTRSTEEREHLFLRTARAAAGLFHLEEGKDRELFADHLGRHLDRDALAGVGGAEGLLAARKTA